MIKWFLNWWGCRKAAYAYYAWTRSFTWREGQFACPWDIVGGLQQHITKGVTERPTPLTTTSKHHMFRLHNTFSLWCIFYVLIDIDCNFTNLLIPVISVRDLSVNPILFPPVKNRIVDMALSSIHKLEEQLFLMRFTSHSVEASTKIIRIEIHHQSETSMSCKLSCI